MFFNENICGIGVYCTLALLLIQVFFIHHKLILTFLFDFSELPQPRSSPKINNEKHVDPKIQRRIDEIREEMAKKQS